MREYKFKNGAHHGRGNDSPPRLYFVNSQNKYIKFTGQTIPGFCIVQNSHFTKNGKWSYTEYQILLHAGVTAWEMSSPYLANPNTWEEVYSADPWVPREIPLEIVKEVCYLEFPKGASKLDERDKIAKTCYIVSSRGKWQADGLIHCAVMLNAVQVDTVIVDPQSGKRWTMSGALPEKYD